MRVYGDSSAISFCNIQTVPDFFVGAKLQLFPPRHRHLNINLPLSFFYFPNSRAKNSFFFAHREEEAFGVYSEDFEFG